MILMRVKNSDYREFAERIADGCTLRQFTQFYSDPRARASTLSTALSDRLTPVLLTRRIDDLVVAAAVEANLEVGNALRVDSTVVEANIHWPTRRHSTLGWDSRSDTSDRTLARNRPGKDVPRFPNRRRSAQPPMQKLPAHDRGPEGRGTSLHLPANCWPSLQEVWGDTRLSVDATSAFRRKKSGPLTLVVGRCARKSSDLPAAQEEQIVDPARPRRVLLESKFPPATRSIPS